jgi:hypothetical protein
VGYRSAAFLTTSHAGSITLTMHSILDRPSLWRPPVFRSIALLPYGGFLIVLSVCPALLSGSAIRPHSTQRSTFVRDSRNARRDEETKNGVSRTDGYGRLRRIALCDWRGSLYFDSLIWNCQPATGLSQLSAFDAYCLFGLATGLSDVFRSIVAYSAGISGFEGAAYVC